MSSWHRNIQHTCKWRIRISSDNWYVKLSDHGGSILGCTLRTQPGITASYKWCVYASASAAYAIEWRGRAKGSGYWEGLSAYTIYQACKLERPLNTW